MTKRMLVQEIWRTEVPNCNHSLPISVARLRQKIEPQPGLFHFIQTIPGGGYRFRDAADEEQGQLP